MSIGTSLFRARSSKVDLKRQENNNTDGVKETQYLCRKSRANSQRDKLAAKIEVRGSRQKKWDARPSRAQGEKSAEITLFFLYGFLDAEQHGSEPLVQPWNGVKFFHLPIPEEILAKKTTQNITVYALFFASKEKLLCWSKLVSFLSFFFFIFQLNEVVRKVRRWKSIFCLKMTDLQSQCRHPRSVLHMHLEVSRSQRRTLL